MVTFCLISWVCWEVSKIFLLYHDFHFWVTLSRSKDHFFFYWNASEKLLNLAPTWLPHLDLWPSVPAPPRLHLMLLPFPSDLLCFIKPDYTVCLGSYWSLYQWYKTVRFSATLLFPAAFPQWTALLFPCRKHGLLI